MPDRFLPSPRRLCRNAGFEVSYTEQYGRQLESLQCCSEAEPSPMHLTLGTFNSEFSMLAWLLCIGHDGHMVPYVNMAERTHLETTQGRLEFRLD